MSFGKHETFHIREGWLYKGMRNIQDRPEIFTLEDAPERLGLGVNMVRALRFWMIATGLAKEMTEAGRRVQHLTPFGQLVWEHDRYLEDEATLWLIHAHLADDPDRATAWYWCFNHFGRGFFDKAAFVEALDIWALSQSGQRIARRTLEREFDCLTRTYVPSHENTSPEDTLESPLAALGLIAEDKQQKEYRLQRSSSEQLGPLVVLYVIQRQQLRLRSDQRTIGLGEVLREPGNAGRVFYLDTVTLSEIVARLRTEYPELALQMIRTTGLDTLTLPTLTADEILQLHYTQIRPEVYNEYRGW